MRTPHTTPSRKPTREPTRLRDRRRHDLTRHGVEQVIAVGIPHDRYAVALHLDTCQMWVLDTGGRAADRGPYLSSRQAWMVANELNFSHRSEVER